MAANRLLNIWHSSLILENVCLSSSHLLLGLIMLIGKKSILAWILCTILLLFCDANVCANIYKHKTPVAKFLNPVNSKHTKSGIELVDCIYVINLDKRPEKWMRMQQILDEKAMSACRFSAINGWEISPENQQMLAGHYPMRMLPGEIGCLLSHVSVIKDAFHRKYKAVWVLEDDIEFVEDPHQISELIAKLTKIDSKWDILYTDVDSKNNLGIQVPALDADFRPDRTDDYPLEHYTERTVVSEDFLRLGQRYGMYSLIISRKGIKKIYKFYSHVYLWSAIDIDIHYIPNILEYSTKRDIVTIWWQSPISDTKEQK